MNDRAVRSGAGGVVFTVSASASVTLAIAAAPAHSGISIVPAYIFGVIAVGGLYLLAAPLLRWWPFMGPRSEADLLDGCIRAGRDTRERITYNKLEPLQEAAESARWILTTGNLLHEHYPAIADRFVLAAGSHDSFSGQALVIQTINAKLAVLTEARTRITG